MSGGLQTHSGDGGVRGLQTHSLTVISGGLQTHSGDSGVRGPTDTKFDGDLRGPTYTQC